ncbi:MULTISPECIES: cyclopropane-fatty-acyl-phospholipid synthase family protein [unclassified Streptomyces]|uniref:cyclopropane-fatty-acyl-phospholipid synthase family protein n=1 Tax=unclassified Streptomyces TaxID=2593676 RepID=UPI002DD919C7|nr:MULTISPECIES: cyclopropane-fatty-acyl-phospholipid synthase family protein [unclassified Streptomyces]WSB78706.1 cyclopropane-fatty-acyl-phospholipid synthase family protein [Streptomyces sp. NBC_01775]WSS13090.1 cyclopropane-fatty-acyl-phospholipid synthase family protein [Streptomyces sp. NBC_01186]WSS41873.1 cyclopropane-fatty-acyl-phospholipid synthase family protein [Streptomyces sp. NBC_01187]
MAGAAQRIVALAEKALGAPLPVRIRTWDRSEAGPPGAPVLVIRNRRALRRVLWRPGELGLARAWVAGDLDIEGDLYAALDLLAELIWEKGDDRQPARSALALARDPDVREAALELVKLAGPGLPPAPPAEEARRRTGLRHTLRRDRKAISHHYDVGNDFYELVLGPSMVYSCAYWQPDGTLEEAQRDKLDLICRKLGLREGGRLLDVGGGWGSLVLHAAREYGVHAVAVTLSREQAAYGRKRVAEEGLTDRIEIRVQDYREVDDGPYDAISSVGMAEHVGSARYREYADDLYALLKPGGRLLNHQIARRPLSDEEAYEVDEFIDAYVFPDGELAPVGRTAGQLEEAGFEVRDVEALREHYALTLRAWVANLESDFARAARLTSPGRARIWRLYMAASALAFERNRIGVNQILAVKTPEGGASGLPLRSREWTADRKRK